ncbi:TRADD-N-associated membrane domain-containing protein [Nonomuraea rubra]|uniref:TRADD-N-associated membrane domain-containing protein n=1 Tax=Nonomuraea rubra TaxID=46180 RepID=UPI0033F3C6CE
MADNGAKGKPIGEPRPSGDEARNVIRGGNFYGPVVVTGEQPATPAAPDLAKERQSFFFDFLRQALKQAETTFRLSVLFMSGGAIILLTGGTLALINASNPDWSYLPLLTSLSGLLITSCGGAFALHSNRARKHLTVQAERIHENIQADTTLTQALDLIDRVDDPVLRDRLKSFTAMRVLNLQPRPDQVADHLFSPKDQSPPEIEQGSSTRRSKPKGGSSA